MVPEKNTSGRAEAQGGGTRDSEDLAHVQVPDSRYDLRILQSFRRIIRAVDLDSRRLLSQYSITGPQLLCLSNVAEGGPMSASELARVIHVSPSTVVGILDRLEQRGLVLRSRDTRDRRIINVVATPLGRELVTKAPSPLHQTLASALQRLTELEQVTIALSLERVVSLIEAGKVDAAPVLETGVSLDRRNTSRDGSVGT